MLKIRSISLISGMVLLFAWTAQAQGVRYDDVALLDTGRPVQGATVTVCASGSTGTPCTPTTSIFSDAALSSPITQPGFQSGAQGNFNFYAACGKYDVSITGNGITGRTKKDQQLGPCGNFNASGAGTSQVKTLQLGSDTAFTAAPRMTFGAFYSGTLSAAGTFAQWIPDKAITITRINVVFFSNGSTCSVFPVVQVTDGVTPINVTATASFAADSGAISQNYAAASTLQIKLSTAQTCSVGSFSNANVIVQYKMQ